MALAYGPRVVGVLLSGYGSDGVSGFIQIKKAGGMSLV
jgi:two-component system, chemotaxis family, protein-glutamate methylesterase/glutaminase